MNEEIQKTISLIKKSYEQPILFHILHSHLAFLVKKYSIVPNDPNQYTKILISSASENNLMNQGMEIKMLQELKILKQQTISYEIKYKLNVICYYMLTRPVALINSMILFSLVSNFIGISDHLDGLIISILNKVTVGRIYGLPINKKISDDAFNRMIEIISKSKLSETNKIKSLVSFTRSNYRPPDLLCLEIRNDFYGYKCLEYISFYVKFTENSNIIKEILPNNPDFIAKLGDYMKGNFDLVNTKSFSLSDCLIEDKSIFDKILLEFNRSFNKKKFVADVKEFVSNLI